MNLDELKTTWKCQDKPDLAQLNPDELLGYLKAEQNRFNRSMFWTDIVVVGALGGAAAYFFVVLSGMEIVWPSYLVVILMLGPAVYLPWRNRQRRRAEKRFDQSLRDELRKNRAQLDSQIRFSLWSGIWVYILPIITALCLFHWQGYLNRYRGIDAFHENVLFNLLVGVGVYGAFWLGTRKLRKQKRQIDLELEALGCPVPEEKTPRIHHVARTLLAIGVLALVGYLLVQLFTEAPRTGSPVQPAPAFDQLGSIGEQETSQLEQIGYWLLERAAPNADPAKFDRTSIFAKVAPFTGVRWGSGPDPESDQPTVRVRGEWLRLTGVDGIPIDRLMQTARERFGDRARMRFSEDLVELLAAAGHHPGWTVTLMLERDDGKGPATFEEEMTSEKREAAREYE